MNKKANKITDKDLAVFFIENIEKKNIISELFSFFGFNCIYRCNINPGVLDSLIKKFENSKNGDVEILTEIISMIAQSRTLPSAEEKDLLNKIKSQINEHLTDDITVEEISENLNMSYYYICHFFKAKTGISIKTYLNQRKIEKAIRILIKTQKKISEIATECGFNNISYFTECFTRAVGISPTEFRYKNQNKFFHDFYNLSDMLLASSLDYVNLIKAGGCEIKNVNFDTRIIYKPNQKFGFLHETAVIKYDKVLYASWYNCLEKELIGYTPVNGMRSFDGGDSWSETEVIADDPTGKILYCPPIYGICDDNLYMFINEMIAADHIHSLDLYVFNKNTNKFEFLWSKPIPFKINTNVVKLSNGKLMIPGRTGELDGFPNIPAVLISDSGKINDEWRLVKIAETGDLPDGKKLVHPEITVIESGGKLYMFCRNDQRLVPLLYISEDSGETWKGPYSHDIPYINSKIYTGELPDGRYYLIANIDKIDRSKLVLYISEKGKMSFEKCIILFDKSSKNIDGVSACHYPCAYADNEKLYITATVTYDQNRRGAVLFRLDLSSI